MLLCRETQFPSDQISACMHQRFNIITAATCRQKYNKNQCARTLQSLHSQRPLTLANFMMPPMNGSPSKTGGAFVGKLLLISRNVATAKRKIAVAPTYSKGRGRALRSVRSTIGCNESIRWSAPGIWLHSRSSHRFRCKKQAWYLMLLRRIVWLVNAAPSSIDYTL